MSLQAANGGPASGGGDAGGFGLDGEGLLRAAALSATRGSGGGNLGVSEGALFGDKGASRLILQRSVLDIQQLTACLSA